MAQNYRKRAGAALDTIDERSIEEQKKQLRADRKLVPARILHRLKDDKKRRKKLKRK